QSYGKKETAVVKSKVTGVIGIDPHKTMFVRLHDMKSHRPANGLHGFPDRVFVHSTEPVE
ncbi:MAG: hypothetical protein ACM3KE_20985, partial [Hyphomicrobiales bacterium]